MFGQSVKDVGKKLLEIHTEFVELRTKLESLKETSTATLDEYKRLIERLAQRMESMEIDHVRERASLDAKIDSLSERLNMLSEKALHVVAGERLARSSGDGGRTTPAAALAAPSDASPPSNS